MTAYSDAVLPHIAGFVTGEVPALNAVCGTIADAILHADIDTLYALAEPLRHAAADVQDDRASGELHGLLGVLNMALRTLDSYEAQAPEPVTFRRLRLGDGQGTGRYVGVTVGNEGEALSRDEAIHARGWLAWWLVASGEGGTPVEGQNQAPEAER